MDSIYRLIGRLKVYYWIILGFFQEIVTSLQNRIRQRTLTLNYVALFYSSSSFQERKVQVYSKGTFNAHY